MKKNVFVNVIIGICLAISSVITAAVVYEYHRLDTVMPASVVTALLGLWGGELLIVAARQVLGSDAISKKPQSADVNKTNRI